MGSPASFDILLRRARRDADLTQEELAERAGLSARVISDLERGVIRAPRPDTLELLFSALGLDAAERASWRQLRRRLVRRGTQKSQSRPAASPAHRASLPEPPTPFVGRDRELGHAVRLLKRPETRLLTLTGTGGIGKTRLAIEVARIARGDYPAGVAFVDLAPLSDPNNVLPAIASVLDIQESTGRSLHEELALALRDRQFLLVLDNFEQVAAAAVAIADLLASCPRLTVLTSSRVPLHVQAEQIYPVPPLAMPDMGAPADPDALMRAEAVALFVLRAQVVQPSFAVTDDNAHAVAELCVRLEGLPLAIELAAARVAIFSPVTMLQRFDQRLQLLTGGARDLPERQRTLRDTIRWSYDLLDPDDQRILRQLSVFAGGWTLDAAEAVTSTGDRGGTATLDALIALTDQHLIRVAGDDDGQPRFAMLDTIREFASEQLNAASEIDETSDRHAAYFLRLAEASTSHIDVGDESEWVELVDREHDNMRAAIGWYRSRNEVMKGLRLVAALHSYWYARGHITEGCAEIRSMLDLASGEPHSAVRARGYHALAALTGWQEDNDEMRSASQAALSIWRALGDQAAMPPTLIMLGVSYVKQGDRQRARETWQECLRLASTFGDHASHARSLTNLGTIAHVEGRLDEALEMCRQSVRISQRAGFLRIQALALYNLGNMELLRGEIAEGKRDLGQSLRLYAALNLNQGVAFNLLALGSLALSEGHPDRAARLRAVFDGLWPFPPLKLNPMPILVADDDLDTLREVLGDEFQTHWDQGAELTVDEAVALALGDDADP